MNVQHTSVVNLKKKRLFKFPLKEQKQCPERERKYMYIPWSLSKLSNWALFDFLFSSISFFFCGQSSSSFMMAISHIPVSSLVMKEWRMWAIMKAGSSRRAMIGQLQLGRTECTNHMGWVMSWETETTLKVSGGARG